MISPVKYVTEALPFPPHPRAKKRLLWQLLLFAFGILGLYLYRLHIVRYSPRARVKEHLPRGPQEGRKVVAGLAWANVLLTLLTKEGTCQMPLPVYRTYRYLEGLVPMGICPTDTRPLLRDNFTGGLRHW